jgi:xanthine dehydrogenase YagS FAD-binding subunit
VGTKPWRAEAAEAALLGQSPTIETFTAASAAAVEGAAPLAQNAFKVDLARRTLERALTTITAGGAQ